MIILLMTDFIQWYDFYIDQSIQGNRNLMINKLNESPPEGIEIIT